jgi:hypothetical protein
VSRHVAGRNRYLLGREEDRRPGLDLETLNDPDHRARDKHVRDVEDRSIRRAKDHHDNSLKHIMRIRRVLFQVPSEDENLMILLAVRDDSPSLRESSPDSASWYQDKTGKDLLHPITPDRDEEPRGRSRR